MKPMSIDLQTGVVPDQVLVCVEDFPLRGALSKRLRSLTNTALENTAFPVCYIVSSVSCSLVGQWLLRLRFEYLQRTYEG